MFSLSGFYHGRTSPFRSITQLPLKCAQELQLRLDRENAAKQAWRSMWPLACDKLMAFYGHQFTWQQKHNHSKELAKPYSPVVAPFCCSVWHKGAQASCRLWRSAVLRRPPWKDSQRQEQQRWRVTHMVVKLCRLPVTSRLN